MRGQTLAVRQAPENLHGAAFVDTDADQGRAIVDRPVPRLAVACYAWT